MFKAVSIGFVALQLVCGSAFAQESKWLTSYDKAVAQAKKESKFVLADFTGSDWCGWCIKLDAEVFAKPEFQEWAAKKAVLLTVDFPRKKKLDGELTKQNDELKKKFGIRGFPTIVFLDGEGKELGRSGYVEGGAEAWIKDAEAKMSAKPAAAEPQEGAAAGAGEKSDWLTSWDEALKASKKQRKPILADFTGSDWCGWCIKLKEEVFDTPEFREWAKKNVILLEVDFPKQKQIAEELKAQNEKLAKEFGIRGYPTILILNSSGKKKGEMGYEEGGPKNWTEKAQKLVNKAK